MTEIGRRGLLKLIGAAPLATSAPLAATAPAAAPALAATTAPAAPPKGPKRGFEPKFFDAHEYATVKVLADIVIPKDERSGGAGDAGVAEFIDFMMIDPLETPKDRQERQTELRGGLRWLDTECSERFEKTFLECTAAEQKAVLDDIAWPKKAKPEHEQGAAFFSTFRDYVASGFWSSKIGIEDLRYTGNVMVAAWNGCGPEVLKKLGLSD